MGRFLLVAGRLALLTFPTLLATNLLRELFPMDGIHAGVIRFTRGA